MYLKFAHEDIKAFAEGPVIFENSGQVIEVSGMMGDSLLLKQLMMPSGEFGPVFVQVDEDGKAVVETSETSSETLQTDPSEGNTGEGSENGSETTGTQGSSEESDKPSGNRQRTR